MKKKSFKKLSLLIVALGFIFVGCNGTSERECGSPCSHDSEKNKTEKVKENHGDMGMKPWVLDIEKATIENTNYRQAEWTGKYMQMVFMSLEPGEVIDLEVHNNHDQFIRIEQGEARVLMGKTKQELDFDEKVYDDWAVFIPGGYWHKVINTGDEPLKLYTIYAPPEHEAGTVNKTYTEAVAYSEEHHHEH